MKMSDHFNTGNTHAQKPADQKTTAVLQVRVRAEDKKAWREAAKKSNQKLAQWAIHSLNNSALESDLS